MDDSEKDDTGMKGTLVALAVDDIAKAHTLALTCSKGRSNCCIDSLGTADEPNSSRSSEEDEAVSSSPSITTIVSFMGDLPSTFQIDTTWKAVDTVVVWILPSTAT